MNRLIHPPDPHHFLRFVVVFRHGIRCSISVQSPQKLLHQPRQPWCHRLIHLPTTGCHPQRMPHTRNRFLHPPRRLLRRVTTTTSSIKILHRTRPTPSRLHHMINLPNQPITPRRSTMLIPYHHKPLQLPANHPRLRIHSHQIPHTRCRIKPNDLNILRMLPCTQQELSRAMRSSSF